MLWQLTPDLSLLAVHTGLTSMVLAWFPTVSSNSPLDNEACHINLVDQVHAGHD